MKVSGQMKVYIFREHLMEYLPAIKDHVHVVEDGKLLCGCKWPSESAKR